jgi:hypothetical protein
MRPLYPGREQLPLCTEVSRGPEPDMSDVTLAENCYCCRYQEVSLEGDG